MIILRTHFKSWFASGLLALGILASSLSSLPAHAIDPIPALAGKKTVLLFAKSRSDASLDRQLALLSERRVELSERKAVVIVVVSRRDAMIVMGYASLPAGTGNALFEALKPEGEGTTIVLLDEQQSEQKRWQQVVSAEELLLQMDAAQ